MKPIRGGIDMKWNKSINYDFENKVIEIISATEKANGLKFPDLYIDHLVKHSGKMPNKDKFTHSTLNTSFGTLLYCVEKKTYQPELIFTVQANIDFLYSFFDLFLNTYAWPFTLNSSNSNFAFDFSKNPQVPEVIYIDRTMELEHPSVMVKTGLSYPEFIEKLV